jgi:hypothetical protein
VAILSFSFSGGRNERGEFLGGAFDVSGLDEVHIFFGFRLGDDGQGRKRIEISSIPIIVVVVEMSVEQVTHGFVRPLANLCDIFQRGRCAVTGVDDEDLSLSNNHRRVSAGVAVIQVLVLDGIHAIRELGDSSLVGFRRIGKRRTGGHQQPWE